MLFTIMFISSRIVIAQETDYKIHSLFVYNFIKYIEWPQNLTEGDFVIGIVGDSPINKELLNMAASKKAKNQTIIVKKITNISEVEKCHLVYVSSGKSNDIKEISLLTKNKPVLLISEREGMAKKGASINFVIMEDDTLKFEINKKVMEGQSLKIPATLLKLAIIVG